MTTENSPQAGVLLVNLGTPAAPTAGAIRRWLREFLHDYRVIELTRWLWCPILYLFILPFRPLKLAPAYRSIWTGEGSPLLVISRRQAATLQAELDKQGKAVKVQVAMRYGEPSISNGLRALQTAGVRRILVLPLYPQYSATTSASVFDAVAMALRKTRWLPELRFVMDYHDDPGYIAALADSLRQHWETVGRGEKLLVSFHGIPQAYSRAGDPYHGQCQTTVYRLIEALQLPDDSWTIGFQSRVGRATWLRPYTDDQVRAAAEAGIRTLDVIAPGFSADCLETLEEIQQRYCKLFRDKGDGELRYVPALNDQPAHIRALAMITNRHLQGWQ